MRPYQLSDEVEKLLHEKSVAGRSAWTLFDETTADLRFRSRTRPDRVRTMHRLSDRRCGGRAALDRRGFGRNVRLFGLINNTSPRTRRSRPLARLRAADRQLANSSRTRWSTR
jgi:oligoendopeptidase F